MKKYRVYSRNKEDVNKPFTLDAEFVKENKALLYKKMIRDESTVTFLREVDEKPLYEVINDLGDKLYDVIEERFFTNYNSVEDSLFGYCKYRDGKLTALDGDTYSLNDLCLKWEEHMVDKELWLTVWVDTEYIK